MGTFFDMEEEESIECGGDGRSKRIGGGIVVRSSWLLNSVLRHT